MTDTAAIEVVCPGMLEVLSIGKGDLKLSIGGDDPEDIEKARQLITEMLKKGYSIFVETDKGPSRVKRFNPKRMTYIISEVVEDALPVADKRTDPRPGSPVKPDEIITSHRGRRRVTDVHVPIAGSRATAIGRTAGG
jgi:hypothetical protein